MLLDLVRLTRPSHWIKNAIVLFPVVLALQMDNPAAWAQAAVALAAFCLASSAAYVLNDVRDRHGDRLHPRKKNRPVAAGRVSIPAATATAGACALAAVAVGLSVNWAVLATVAIYLALQAAYTYFLKDKMLADVICIALGFVMRAAGGALAIGVEISPWLFVCTFTICLFMGFCKRFNEIATADSAEIAGLHRPTLLWYTPELLTHLITVSAGIAVVAFLLYATDERTVHEKHLGTNYLIYTLPLFIYGVFRFAMLSMKGKYNDPTDLLLRDRPMQLTIVLWLAAVVGIIRWGRDIRAYLAELAGG